MYNTLGRWEKVSIPNGKLDEKIWVAKLATIKFTANIISISLMCFLAPVTTILWK
jgi:hypothetical protein